MAREPVDFAVIGGGAAGFFAACNAAGTDPGLKISIFEAHAERVLAKVAISGGGRCNLTHACFNPRTLCEHYPRGAKALIGVFKRFGPEQVMDWFADRGVLLKTEQDGRVFPASNDSKSVVNALRNEALRLGVCVENGKKACRVKEFEGGFVVGFEDGDKVFCRKVLLATGGAKSGFELARQLGHKVVDPVGALFAFECGDDFAAGLAGVSVGDVELSCGFGKAKSRSGLLFTENGVSGPAVLRLSSLFARQMAQENYQFCFNANWLPQKRHPEVMEEFQRLKNGSPDRLVANSSLWGCLPKRLWTKLMLRAGVGLDTVWRNFSKRNAECLAAQLLRCGIKVVAKAANKSEFVTCGGVELSEVDFKTMQSKLCRGVFFAGEILDVDGFTGGFNFQNAWSTAYLAAVCATCKK